jgi:phosphoribosyl 1,2-cyclic phosphodiesterase
MDIIFLGTGGGRWTTLTQRLGTGGFRIHSTKRLHIDPGPGALVAMANNGISPVETDAVLVTHCHPDHYNDAEILIEAMTKGMTKSRGILAASESVLVGKDYLGPAISRYHRSKVEEAIVLRPRNEFEIYGSLVEAIPTRHTDPTCVGLKFHTEAGAIAYTSDTQYYDELPSHLSESRLIILNVMRPGNKRIPWHLCTDDAVEIAKETEPEILVLQHFGMKMIGITEREATRVEKESGVKTVSATDGMRLKLE